MLEERATAEQFNTFIDKLANDKTYGWTKDEMNEYVSFLKTAVPRVMADNSSKSSGGSGVRIKETEGLITIVSPDSQIITLKFRSHLELHWLLTQDITLSQLLSLQQQQSQQIKYEIAEKKDQNISRGGPSL